MNPRKTLWRIALSMALVLPGLNACQFMQVFNYVRGQNPDLTLTAQAESNIFLFTSIPSTPVPRLNFGTPAADGNAMPDQLRPASDPNQAGEPIQFVFPTPQPAPVSIWRPPLNSAPWALIPEDHFYFARPIAADKINWPLADYRYGALSTDTNAAHTGIDIDAPTGTPVLAAGAGTIVWVGYGLFKFTKDITDPYGLAVVIEHNFGHEGNRLYTVYAHMKEAFVSDSQWVETGTKLGLVGTTGNTTGPHLHFEVRYGENSYYATRNPELWLAPPQGWGVLAGRVMKADTDLMRQKEVVIRSADRQRVWYSVTYGPLTVKSDPYYRENMVLSDLPEGKYTLEITHDHRLYSQEITINAGMVTYFTFYAGEPIIVGPPPAPSPDTFLTPQPVLDG